MVEKIVKSLWQASDDKKVCRINLKGEPFPRVIHPYGVCKTSTNKIVLVCKQSTGFTKGGGDAGYRNLFLEKIQDVEMLDEHFKMPDDFNPSDDQYKEWVYHI